MTNEICVVQGYLKKVYIYKLCFQVVFFLIKKLIKFFWIDLLFIKNKKSK